MTASFKIMSCHIHYNELALKAMLTPKNLNVENSVKEKMFFKNTVTH